MPTDNAARTMPSSAFGQVLFTPFSSGRLTLPNRLVMAPMTRRFTPTGVPGPENARYYGKRAEGGVGLIITEGTWIGHPAAHGYTDIPRFYGEAMAGWKLVVDAVHRGGGKIFPQLWHLGGQRKPPPEGAGAPTVSPSGISPGGKVCGQPLTQSGIDELIDAYARGAQDAQRAGFDGVELHAAHGYLIDQFFWARTNLRADRYGGGIAQRTRFAVEIVQEIKRRTGADFPVCLRLSQWKPQDYEARLADTPQEWAAIVEPLAAAGTDIFHISTRRYRDPAFAGSDATLAQLTKQITCRTVITVGSVGLSKPKDPGIESPETMYSAVDGDLGDLYARLDRGDFDLVAMGRGLLANPAWPRLVQGDRAAELRPYTLDVREQLV